MQIKEIWEDLANTIAAVPSAWLLLMVVAAIAFSALSSSMVKRNLPFGIVARRISMVVLAAVLVLVVLQSSRIDTRSEISLSQIGFSEPIVEGHETRISRASDGHYWLKARINNIPADFLVDTGATFTAISKGLADRADIQAHDNRVPIKVNTANGSVSAELSRAQTFEFGSVVARGINVVIIPTLGETNVVGMNFLSKLASWRVDNQTNEMVLVPNKDLAK